MGEALQDAVVDLLRPAQTEQSEVTTPAGDGLERSAAQTAPAAPPVVQIQLLEVLAARGWGGGG